MNSKIFLLQSRYDKTPSCPYTRKAGNAHPHPRLSISVSSVFVFSLAPYKFVEFVKFVVDKIRGSG